MKETTSNKFMALYLIPASVMAEWEKKDASQRKDAEEQMKAQWQQWMKDNAKSVKVTEGCGKTKRVAASGIADGKNDICLYSIVEAESQEAAAKIFKNHPHLQIPESSIEIMPLRAL